MKIKTMLRFLLCFLAISGLGSTAYADVGDYCNGNINTKTATCDCDNDGYALEATTNGGYKHKALLKCECGKLVTYDATLKDYVCKDTNHYVEVVDNKFNHTKKTLYLCKDGNKIVYEHEGSWYYCECEQYGRLVTYGADKGKMKHEKSRICDTCKGTVNYNVKSPSNSSCSTGHIVTESKKLWIHNKDKMSYVCENDKYLTEIVAGEKYHCSCDGDYLVNKTPSADGKYAHLAELKCSSCTGLTKANIKYDNKENEYYCDREKCYVKLSKNLWYHGNKMTGQCENGKIVNTYDKNIYYCECNYFVNKSSNNTYKHDLKKLKTCSEHQSNIIYDKNVKSYICSGVMIEYKNGKWIHSNATQEFCENNKNLLKITDTIRHCECDTYGYVTSEWDENGNYPHKTLLKCSSCNGQVAYDTKANEYFCSKEGNYVELVNNDWTHLEKTTLLCEQGNQIFEFGDSGKYYCDCTSLGQILVGDASKSEANRKHARPRTCTECYGKISYISSKDRYACTSGVLLSYQNGRWVHTTETSSFCQGGKNITRQNNGDYHCDCGYFVKQTVKGGEYKHLAELKCRMCGSKVIYESTGVQTGRYYCSNTTLEVKLDNNKWYVLCPTGNVVKEIGVSGKYYCDCGYFINKEVKETSSFEKPKISWVHGISRECDTCKGKISYDSSVGKYYCEKSKNFVDLNSDNKYFHSVTNQKNLTCEKDKQVREITTGILVCDCDEGYFLKEDPNEGYYAHYMTRACTECDGNISYNKNVNDYFCDKAGMIVNNSDGEWSHSDGKTPYKCEKGSSVTATGYGYICACQSVIDFEPRDTTGAHKLYGKHFVNPKTWKHIGVGYYSDPSTNIAVCIGSGKLYTKSLQLAKCSHCGGDINVEDHSGFGGPPKLVYVCKDNFKSTLANNGEPQLLCYNGKIVTSLNSNIYKKCACTLPVAGGTGNYIVTPSYIANGWVYTHENCDDCSAKLAYVDGNLVCSANNIVCYNSNPNLSEFKHITCSKCNKSPLYYNVNKGWYCSKGCDFSEYNQQMEAIKNGQTGTPGGNHTVVHGGPSASYFFNAGAEQAKKGYEAVDNNLSPILHIQSLIMMISTYVGVIVIIIYGIQWTIATPNKRQELKAGLIPLVLGVILLIVGPRLAIIIVESLL